MKIDPDGNVLGAVYEEDGTFYYECEHCCTMFSGPNEYRVELKADQHEAWHQKQVDQ